jgi:hypothetical protein
MDFDNLQSVTSSVSDTLPFEAISITGRDCFWDGSVPNSLVSVGSPTMSVSSIMPEPLGAGARVGGLAGPVPSRHPYEKTGGLEPGRFKPIEEPGAEEKDPVVFTGLETVWVKWTRLVYPPLVLTELGPQDRRLSHLLPKAQA